MLVRLNNDFLKHLKGNTNILRGPRNRNSTVNRNYSLKNHAREQNPYCMRWGMRVHNYRRHVGHPVS